MSPIALIFCSAVLCMGIGAAPSADTRIRKAIADNDLQALRLALKSGADPNLPDARYLPPLVYAVNAGSETFVVELLNSGANANPTNVARTPLEAAFESKLADRRIGCNVSIVRILLEHGADVNAVFPLAGERPLQRALELGDAECVNAVIAAGGDWRAISPGGKSALEAAIQGASASNNPALISQILALGADVNGDKTRRGGPLIEAIGRRDIPVIQQLLTLGANPCVHGGAYGISPWTAAIGGNDTDIVNLLAGYHCDSGPQVPKR